MTTGPIKSIETLEKRIELLASNNDVVFITPHIGPDIDGVGSAIGLNLIMQKLGKESYIVIDEDFGKLEQGVKTVLKETPSSVNVIGLEEAASIMENKNVLLVTTDTNKGALVPFDRFDLFNDILIIDHHEIDDSTILTDNMYINTKVSSTCEIVYLLLEMMNIDFNLASDDDKLSNVPNVANYLLGGIVLDTSKFKRNTSSDTMKIVSNLMARGASLDYSYSLFLDDFVTDVRVSQLVGKSTFKSYPAAIDYNVDEPTFVYKKEDLAKAANILIKYKSTEVAFAIGYITSDTVYISARSKGSVNVQQLMHEFGGGGNERQAAAQIEGVLLEEVLEKLNKLIIPGNNLAEKGNYLIKK